MHTLLGLTSLFWVLVSAALALLIVLIGAQGTQLVPPAQPSYPVLLLQSAAAFFAAAETASTAAQGPISVLRPVLDVVCAAARFDLGEHHGGREAMRLSRGQILGGGSLDAPLSAVLASPELARIPL